MCNVRQVLESNPSLNHHLNFTSSSNLTRSLSVSRVTFFRPQNPYVTEQTQSARSDRTAYIPRPESPQCGMESWKRKEPTWGTSVPHAFSARRQAGGRKLRINVERTSAFMAHRCSSHSPVSQCPWLLQYYCRNMNVGTFG